MALGSILAARFLGSEAYGLYSLSLVAPMLLASIIGLGLDSAAIRFPAKYRAEERYGHILVMMRSALTFRLVTGVAASLLCFISSDFLASSLLNRPELGFYVKMVSALVLFQTLFFITYNFFIGLESVEKASILKALMSIVKASSSPVLIILGLGVSGAIIGHVLGYLVASVIGLLMLYLGNYRSLKSAIRHEQAAEENSNFIGHVRLMIGYGFPLYILSMLTLLLGQYQFILLAHYASDIEIGSFQAVLNLSSILTVLIVPITTSLFPAFSKLESTKALQELERFLNLSIRYSSLIIIPVTILVMSLSTELVNVIYGADYKLATLYLPIYISIFLSTGLGCRIMESFFNGIGETKLTLKIYLANLAIFIPLAPILTKFYGIPGFIVALLASNLASTLYGLALAKRKLQVNIGLTGQLKIYISSILSALPTLVFLQFSNLTNILNLLIASAIFLITYFTLTPILKSVNQSDLQNLKQIFEKIRVLWPIIKLAIDYEGKILAIIVHLNKKGN